jgi:hypothetical protein
VSRAATTDRLLDVSSSRSSRAATTRLARAVLLVSGVAATTIAFVGLIDEQLVVAGAAPWWYLGIAGIVATLLALGSPRQA